MKMNNVEINILIKGRAATEYKSPMDFQTYIEGRDGSEFEIEFVNHNAVDVEAILSVDGLSVTTGKPAGSDSSGYMVPARGRISIPGWTLDKGQVAKFFFAGDKGGSYAEQSGQDDRNKGVIGAKVFARKQRQPVFRSMAFGAAAGTRSLGLGGEKMKSVSPRGGDMLGGAAVLSSAPSWNAGTASASLSIGGTASVNNISSPATSFSFNDQSEMTRAAEVEQTLGTGFGEATDFATTQVDFERGDLLALIELFYDDAQGLKRRGIDTRRPLSRPSAFPADEPKGCTPPANWQGR